MKILGGISRKQKINLGVNSGGLLVCCIHRYETYFIRITVSAKVKDVQMFKTRVMAKNTRIRKSLENPTDYF